MTSLHTGSSFARLGASLTASLRGSLARTLHRDLFASPRGRAYVLRQLATAESCDEATIFDEVRKYCGDDEIEKIVRKHEEDELRHALLFEECVARQGRDADPGPVPEELQLLKVLDKYLAKSHGASLLAGTLLQGEEGARNRDEGIARAYVLLWVIEERALLQFKQMNQTMRMYDPQTSSVIDEVIADEERHLKYCQAIVKRFAPSEHWQTAELLRFRAAEEHAFQRVQLANLQELLARDLLSPRTRRLFGPLAKGLGFLRAA